jgi:Zn-dependent protease with chaperone function
MVGALQSLAEAANMPVVKDSFTMAKISSNRKVSLWSTHPSIDDRIARLQGK